ncbi:MAG: hypothetical protein WBD34_20825 [Burkholderiaceae bacterium]
MLRVRGATGSFEIDAGEEARVRGFSDAELCVRLNREPDNELYLVEANTRNSLHFSGLWGWLPMQ